MNILVLEDDFFHQKKILEALEKAAGIRAGEVFVSSVKKEFLDQVDKVSGGSLYFLDLEIKGDARAGFTAAEEIRKKDLLGVIVFITTHSEMAPITFEYQVSALDFIAKDLPSSVYEARVASCLEKAQRQLQTLVPQIDLFSFKNKYCNFQVPFQEIIYFETSEIPHKLRLVMSQKEIEFYADLKEIEGMDERFFRSHRSYLINISKVRTVHKKEKEVEFDGGQCCYVSKRYLRQLLEVLDGR